MARSIGLTPERIVWNGAALSDSEAHLAVREGVRCVGINTLDDLNRVAAAARSCGRENVPIWLRIYPEDINSDYLCPGSRLGFDVADGSAIEVTGAALATQGVTLRGLHCHTQVNQVNPDKHAQTLAAVISFALRLNSQFGFRVQSIGLGGGFAGRTDMLRTGGDIAAFGGAFKRLLEELPWQVELIIEPGRFMVDDAAIGLTRVLSRTHGAGKTWWIIDLGTHFLVPFNGREFEVAPVILSQRMMKQVSIGDRLSSFSGVIKRDAWLPSDVPDGLLAVLRVGAYTSSAAQRFIYGMPEIVIVNHDHTEVLWCRETDNEWVNEVLGAGC